MKTNLLYYIHLLQNNYNGSPWYGESLRQKLEGIREEEAFAEPAPGLHSVAQQVAHVLAWRRLLAERIKGNNHFQIQLDSARDWPPHDLLHRKGWTNLLEELDANQKELIQLLEVETDALLDRPLPDGKHNFRLLIDGIVQHDVYHNGQIGQTIRLLQTARTPAVSNFQ